jgi:hypothetical protein
MMSGAPLFGSRLRDNSLKLTERGRREGSSSLTRARVQEVKQSDTRQLSTRPNVSALTDRGSKPAHSPGPTTPHKSSGLLSTEFRNKLLAICVHEAAESGRQKSSNIRITPSRAIGNSSINLSKYNKGQRVNTTALNLLTKPTTQNSFTQAPTHNFNGSFIRESKAANLSITASALSTRVATKPDSSAVRRLNTENSASKERRNIVLSKQLINEMSAKRQSINIKNPLGILLKMDKLGGSFADSSTNLPSKSTKKVAPLAINSGKKTIPVPRQNTANSISISKGLSGLPPGVTGTSFQSKITKIQLNESLTLDSKNSPSSLNQVHIPSGYPQSSSFTQAAHPLQRKITDRSVDTKMEKFSFNLLTEENEEPEEQFGAAEHRLREIFEKVTLSLEWVKANWSDVIFVLKQHFNRVSYLNSFEKVLHLYHIVGISFPGLQHLDFSEMLPAEFVAQPSKASTNKNSYSMLEQNQPQLPLRGHNNFQSFIETPTVNSQLANQIRKLSKPENGDSNQSLSRQPAKSIWATRPSSRASTTQLNPAQSYFFSKALCFFFKAAEDNVRAPTLNYERLVLMLEALVSQAIKVHPEFRPSIVQAFGRLFENIDQFGYLVELEDYCILCETYFIVCNQLLEAYVSHFAKGTHKFAELDFETFELDVTLDRLLKRQKQRTAIVENISYKLMRHFTTLKDLLIVVPATHTMLMGNLFATVFVFCKYSQTYNFIRLKNSGRFSAEEIFQSIYLQMLESLGNKLIEHGLDLSSGRDRPEQVLLLSLFTRTFSHLERHMQQANLFEASVQMKLDQLILRESLVLVQRLIKVAIDKKRKDPGPMLEPCIKIISMIVSYLGSLITSSEKTEVLRKYSFLEVHLRQFSQLIRESRRINVPQASDLVTLMDSLATMLSQINKQLA